MRVSRAGFMVFPIEYKVNYVMVAREQGVSYNDYEGIERLFNKF